MARGGRPRISPASTLSTFLARSDQLIRGRLTTEKTTPITPNLQQIMGQAHQPPFAADLVQATQQKPVKARASLIWPKTGSSIAFRRAYTARPAVVFSFACIFSLAVAGATAGSDAAGWSHRGVAAAPSRCRDRNPHAPCRHRRLTEVARVQHRRDQRPVPGLIRSRCHPGLVQLATGGRAIGSAWRLSLHSAVTSHARMIWQPSATLAGRCHNNPHPLLAVFMIDNSGSVKLIWAFSAGVSTIGPVPTTTLRPGALSLGFGVLAPLPFGVSRGAASASSRFIAASIVVRRSSRRRIPGQLIAPPRAQRRIVLGIDVPGLLEQLLDLGPQPADFLGHVAIAHGLVPRGVALDLGPIDGDRAQADQPAAFARRRTWTNTLAKASRWVLRNRLMVRNRAAPPPRWPGTPGCPQA